MGIVVPPVTGDFIAQKVRTKKWFIRSAELYLSHDETFVVTKKLIDFNGVTIGHRY